MAISAFAKSRLETISNSGFKRAKKLADLALKVNVDGKGNTTARGYEEAIGIMQPYTVSEIKNEGVDAQRVVAGYTNKFTKLQQKRSKVNRTIGQFRIDEREIFFIQPTSGNRTDIMRDVPSMVSQISEELSLHIFSVENAIEEAQLNNESSSELEAYLFDVQRRASSMSELNNDLINNEISVGEVIKGYGVYVDTDPNDGEMLGVMVAPLGNLPQGIDSKIFKQVDSSVQFGDGFIPILGRSTTDGTGLQTVKIGNQVWDGTGGLELQYSKKQSQTPQFKNDPGEFTLSSVVDKGVALRTGSFSKGFTGFDDEGNPKQTTFYSSQDGKVYTVDDKTLDSMRGDSLIGRDIERATLLDSSFAKNLMSSEGVQPLNFSPITNSVEAAQEEARMAPRIKEEERQKSLGFFGRARERAAKTKEAEAPRSSFFERKNVPDKPDEPSTTFQTPDIIEKGKEFFRTNPLTKPFVEGFFGK